MPSIPRISALACAATALALVGVASGRWSAIEGLDQSYAQVFERLEDGRQPVGPMLNPAHIHLSHMPAAASPRAVFAKGDVLTLAARDGGTIAYRVIDVRALSDVAAGAAASGQPGLMMVTAVSADDTAPKTIRFILDADSPSDATNALQPRAL